MIPAQFRVVVTERPKFACRACAGVVAPGPVGVEFCWSYARRQFYDPALKPKAPISEEALRRIAAPYPIEAEILRTPPEQHMAKRRSSSFSLVEELFVWFEVTLAKLTKPQKVRSPTPATWCAKAHLRLLPQTRSQ